MYILIFSALMLCVATAISLVIALVALFSGKPKTERLTGVISLVSAIISFLIYYYARIIESGGNLSDWRVAFTLAVYAAAGILSIIVIVDGNRKMKYSCS